MAKAAKKNAFAMPHAKAGKARSARKNEAKALGAEIGAELSQTSDTHSDPEVLNRLWSIIELRRNADPNVSHSARLLGRGTAKVAQKFGEEAVECLIEVVAGNRTAAVAESADVLYHLLVMWVEAGIRPEEVWSELEKRERASGMAEGRNGSPIRLSKSIQLGTTKIP